MTTFHVQFTHPSPAPAGGSAGAAQVCPLLQETLPSVNSGPHQYFQPCPFNPNRCCVSTEKQFTRLWVCCFSGGNMVSFFLFFFK